MSKKLIIFLISSATIIVILFLLGILVKRAKNQKPQHTQNRQTSTTTTSTTNSIEVSTSPAPTFIPPETLDANDYTVEWIIVRDPKKVFLYSNLQDEFTSAEALKKHGCDQLITGGFYSQNNTNLGLIISEGALIEEAISSKLFNGFFYITNDETFSISGTQPDTKNVRLALQSGPLLFKNSAPQSLNIENDENARRVVVGTTQKDEIVYLVFYYKPSPLLGPKLAELPELLRNIQTSTNLKFNSALNLDGGSHSAFLSQQVHISEISRPGSFFCIKP